MEDGELSDDSEDDSVYVDEKLIPPGRWRIGVPYHKTKHKLFMRYATNGVCVSIIKFNPQTLIYLKRL